MGSGGYGAERVHSAQFTLHRRKQAQKDAVTYPRPHGKLMVGHFYSPGSHLPAQRLLPGTQEAPLSALHIRPGQEHTHQNSPSSCTVTPNFSRSLLLTFCHSSELGCEHRGGKREEYQRDALRATLARVRRHEGQLSTRPPSVWV